MIVVWIVLALVVVLALVLVLAARNRRRSRVATTPPPRAAMPEVLVTEVAPRPEIDDGPGLDRRLASSRSIFDRVRSITSVGTLTKEQLDVVEEVLLRSDVGVSTTTALLDELRANGAPEGVASAIRQTLVSSFGADRSVRTSADEGRVPVWLFVGVNGVGKTTTIGKLAWHETQAGRTVVLAAGDTFRAAAADQLQLWADRTGADIVRAGEGADPGSVIHDALGRAQARHADLVLADTAGRRANSTNLLDELAKIRRVADRGPGQVVETFMVLDATTGQNALSQAREFLTAAQVTGIVLTKLDGTARGGIVVAIERELGIPVKFVGVGERAKDLLAFEPTEFVDSLLSA
ncbi:MAG: signal recognition particle-docking protein FtsY [Acidobacteriota bacterium]|nr:signal recognition particle-docking protein FtsY [Acidobacteriota bacterium]MDE3093160.1 signal recognition particle-docking protein FtsY [Acidobacteriota bacterium]